MVAAWLAAAVLGGTEVAHARGDCTAADVAALTTLKTESWPRLYRMQDVAGLAALLLDDFVVVGGDGRPSTRAEELAWLARERWNPDDFRYTVTQLSCPAPDTAIIVGEGRFRSTAGGVTTQHRYVSSNLLVRADGRWRAALSQISGERSEPVPPSVDDTCLPPGWSRERMEALKRAGFAFDDVAGADRWALGVVACLAAPDPGLRDGIVYEGLARLLAGKLLSAAARQGLAQRLQDVLARTDPGGFGPPFAALVLAELVRADRAQPVLQRQQVRSIAERAAAFVSSVRDHRGFDEREGWRHAVAHGADLLAQLARHPAIDEPALFAALRDAVAAQVAPAGHFYVHGEPERLMTPVVVLAQRGAFDATDWTAWFERVASPAPLASWSAAFGSQAGLARRHDVRAFLLAVLVEARLNDNPADDLLLPAAEAALRRMR
jgi:ketosteroid isomerase-like protein